MAAGRLTRPGVTDDEFMLVTCTPDTTTAEFFEFQDEGLDAARMNLHPTTSTYLAKVTHQGEHTVRGTAKHIAVTVTVDDELRRALQHHAGVRGRAKVAAFLQGLIDADLAQIREDYRAIRSPVGQSDPLPRDANCANCRGPFLPGQMVAKRDDYMLVHAASDCRTDDDAIALPSMGRGQPARLPSQLVEPSPGEFANVYTCVPVPLVDKLPRKMACGCDHPVCHGHLPERAKPNPSWWSDTSCSSRGWNEPRCHPGDRCDNFPACKHCGPARL